MLNKEMDQSQADARQSDPLVAAIVLNWNGREETLLCLESLAKVKYSNLMIIVVDNGSEDESVSAVHASYPVVKVIETGANLGYAGGNNVGISYALNDGAEYILILNNDATIDPEALTFAVSVAQRSGPTTGVVGFATYRHGAPEVLHSLGLNAGAHRGFYVPTAQQMQEREVLPIASAHGCAMLLTLFVYGCWSTRT